MKSVKSVATVAGVLLALTSGASFAAPDAKLSISKKYYNFDKPMLEALADTPVDDAQLNSAIDESVLAEAVDQTAYIRKDYARTHVAQREERFVGGVDTIQSLNNLPATAAGESEVMGQTLRPRSYGVMKRSRLF